MAVQQLSVRSTVVGLVIGSLVLCANFQFGLQTGWVSMMSMPSALLGFAAYKAIRTPLSPQENVYIQSVAVATGTGPLAFGFVGAIPAIELLISKFEGRTKFSVSTLILWSFGVSFVGIFTAKLLRKYTMADKDLKFPSGSAAASLIAVLHHSTIKPAGQPDAEDYEALDESVELASHSPVSTSSEEATALYKSNIAYLSYSFLGSSLFTVLAKFWPFLRQIPFAGNRAAAQLWYFDPSPAYVGQGIIMGFETTLSMFWGVILGWLILAPLAHAKGWAPGSIDDWRTGGQGWIMWVSLAIMLADTFVALAVLIYKSATDSVSSLHNWRRLPTDPEARHSAPLPSASRWTAHGPAKVAFLGLVVASALCVTAAKLIFPSAPFIELVVAVIFAPLLGFLAIRALGETDLNPVSSLAKLTQLIFGAMVRNRKGAIVLNIVAGAIAEAGAQQAGDLMQDFKTGQLLGASNVAQFIGMVIGTLWSTILSAVVYKLYKSVYTIPNKEFRIPTAYMWADAARLMTGEGLPPRAWEFSLAFGALFVVLSVLKICKGWRYIPSGVAVGVGMYSIPSFTLARFIGGIIALAAAHRFSGDTKKSQRLTIASSGLILGEGVISVLALLVSLGGGL